METVTVKVDFPKSVFFSIESSGLTGTKIKEEVKEAVALDLFKKGVLSLGKAAELAKMCIADFIDLLGNNKIPLHYTGEDFDADLKTIKQVENTK